mmetsp:Transcript_8255/g.21319  ORF Transcript_8255/g.21319 Transcript_8255/m.21319 type:complete len:380 (+) Transcript_8255:61-1200(+)
MYHCIHPKLPTFNPSQKRTAARRHSPEPRLQVAGAKARWPAPELPLGVLLRHCRQLRIELVQVRAQLHPHRVRLALGCGDVCHHLLLKRLGVPGGGARLAAQHVLGDRVLAGHDARPQALFVPGAVPLLGAHQRPRYHRGLNVCHVGGAGGCPGAGSRVEEPGLDGLPANVNVPDGARDSLLRALLVGEAPEVLLRLWVRADAVFEALLRQAEEVAPSHGPDRHGPVLREAQNAVLPEEGALLELRKDAVLLVQDHLDRPLDEEKHAVTVLPRLVQKVAGGERLRLEAEDDVCEELLAAVAEEGHRGDEVVVEVQRDLCAEGEGELLDGCGDVSRVVVAVFEEGARAEAEVEGEILLVHEVVEVLHPLLEGGGPDVELA